MFFLQLFGKLIKLLRSADKPGQLAGGFILGMMLGLVSFKSLFVAPVILLIIVLNVNLSMTIFAFILFKLIAFLFDRIFHSLGYWLLVDLEFLQEVWRTLAGIKIVPYTRFNNTVVLGSFFASLLLLIPVFIGVKRFLMKYKEKYQPKIEKLKFVRALKGSKLYTIFSKIVNLGA